MAKITILVLVLGLIALPALAGNVSGYAWSENIGWIKFSGPNYGVNINPVTGNFSGYGWSSNIGWVNFNGPRLDFTTNQITGRANILAWGGQLSLKGPNYRVERVVDNIRGCSLEGWAWGSDIVGWVKFGGPNYRVSTTICPIEPIEEEVGEISCSFSASPSRLIYPRRSSSLSWVCEGADTCNISGVGSVNAQSGTVGINVPRTTSYTLSCANEGGSTFSSLLTIKVFKPVYCEIIPQGPGCD